MTPSQRKISHLIVAAAALISVAGVQAQTGAGSSSFGTAARLQAPDASTTARARHSSRSVATR